MKLFFRRLWEHFFSKGTVVARHNELLALGMGDCGPKSPHILQSGLILEHIIGC